MPFADFCLPTDVREPLLNVHSEIQERVFVREVFTYKVTLKNPHSTILNLIASFNVNGADGFMFAGHRKSTLRFYRIRSSICRSTFIR